MIEINGILAPDQRAVREKTVILIWVITVNAWPLGGTFNIATDAGTEFAVLAGIGYSASLTENLNFNASVDARENFADWKLTDSVSGASGSVGNYLTYGLRIGLNYR